VEVYAYEASLNASIERVKTKLSTLILDKRGCAAVTQEQKVQELEPLHV